MQAVYPKGITGYGKSSTPLLVHTKSKQIALINILIAGWVNGFIQELLSVNKLIRAKNSVSSFL